jgi:hypothetical protein
MLCARDNPFAVHRVLRERYRLDAPQWDTLLARLEALRWRAAIVGPHGSGKTTLLEDLAERLSTRDWQIVLVRLSRERCTVPGDLAPATFGPRDMILVDGAEQLSLPAWWWLRWQTRRAGGLIITTHASGRLPVAWRCETSARLLRNLATSLGVEIAPSQAADLHARHRGNVRAALRELYDRAAAGMV